MRLADLGLIRYVRREYIDLTPAGEAEARRIYARHQLLTRFLAEILDVSPESAESDACAMEHSLSVEGMDRVDQQVCHDAFELCEMTENPNIRIEARLNHETVRRLHFRNSQGAPNDLVE